MSLIDNIRAIEGKLHHITSHITGLFNRVAELEEISASNRKRIDNLYAEASGVCKPDTVTYVFDARPAKHLDWRAPPPPPHPKKTWYTEAIPWKATIHFDRRKGQRRAGAWARIGGEERRFNLANKKPHERRKDEAVDTSPLSGYLMNPGAPGSVFFYRDKPVYDQRKGERRVQIGGRRDHGQPGSYSAQDRRANIGRRAYNACSRDRRKA